MSETIKYNYEQYSLDLPKSCYFPSDDSFLLLDTLKKEIKDIYDDVLEIGFGSGILSLYLYDYSKNIDCCDVNLENIDYLKKLKNKYSLEKMTVVVSDLFDNLNKKYDLIVFNPPYVPSEDINKKDYLMLATDGGKDGCEIIIEFLNNLDKYLKKKGVCYLLISSLNNFNNLVKKYNQFSFEIINSKKLFFEELLILKIKKSDL